MASRWLRCKVARGMFSDEFSVTCRAHAGSDFSLFVPKERVREDQQPAVQVEEIARRDDVTLAVFPNDARTAVAVRTLDLLP